VVNILLNSSQPELRFARQHSGAQTGPFRRNCDESHQHGIKLEQGMEFLLE
jgi:hypothetical protein